MSDDIAELLAFMENESRRYWECAAAHRHVFPAGLIKQAELWDRRIAAVRHLTTPENVEEST